jgi:hypothetical protein
MDEEVPTNADYDRVLEEIRHGREKSKAPKKVEPPVKESPLPVFEEPSASRENILNRISNKARELFRASNQFVREIPLRIAVPIALAVTVGTTSGITSYNHELKRKGQIPLGFSEIHQIIDDAKNNNLVGFEGEQDGMARTLFLAGSNEIYMKIFEDWNEANNQSGNVYTNFGRKLSDRLHSEKRHYFELGDLFPLVSESGNKVSEQFSKFRKMRGELPGIASAFDNSWNEKHRDNYHTETYHTTETYTDSKGHSHTRSVTKTRQVYDNSDHWYWYHPDWGESASRNLDSLIENMGDITIQEKIFRPTKTHLEGRRAARESRKDGEKFPELTDADFRKISDTWYTGSTLLIKEREAYGKWSELKLDANSWRENKTRVLSSIRDPSLGGKGDHFHFRNYHSSHPGPAEYQVCCKAKGDSNEMNQLLGEAIDSVGYSMQNLPVLRQKVQDLADSAGNGRDCKHLGKEVLSLSQELYQKNFQGGFEVDRFRTYMIPLWAMLGIAVGGGLGAGINFVTDKYRSKRDAQSSRDHFTF